MLFSTLFTQNFTKVCLVAFAMAAYVREYLCLDVNNNKPAYLPEFNHTNDWSQECIFDCGISLSNLESQPINNSGGYSNQQAVPII